MAQVVAYDRELHDQRSASYTHCAQGGTECPTPPVFTVRGPAQKISACDRHLAGAVREANRMPARAG
jgi:hypothetical protein